LRQIILFSDPGVLRCTDPVITSRWNRIRFQVGRGSVETQKNCELFEHVYATYACTRPFRLFYFERNVYTVLFNVQRVQVLSVCIELQATVYVFGKRFCFHTKAFCLYCKQRENTRKQKMYILWFYYIILRTYVEPDVMFIWINTTLG